MNALKTVYCVSWWYSESSVEIKKKNKTPSSFLPTRSQDASGFDDYMIMALDYVSASYLQKGNRFNEYNK